MTMIGLNDIVALHLILVAIYLRANIEDLFYANLGYLKHPFTTTSQEMASRIYQD